MAETVHINGKDVQVIETEDGFEAHEASKTKLMEQYVEDHPALECSSTVGGGADFTLKADFENAGTLAPGRANIGTKRTQAYHDHLEPYGYSLSIEWMEPASGNANWWNVAVSVEE